MLFAAISFVLCRFSRACRLSEFYPIRALLLTQIDNLFLSGVRILDGPMTDSLEAMAFNSKMDINDIYSCRSVSMVT